MASHQRIGWRGAMSVCRPCCIALLLVVLAYAGAATCTAVANTADNSASSSEASIVAAAVSNAFSVALEGDIDAAVALAEEIVNKFGSGGAPAGATASAGQRRHLANTRLLLGQLAVQAALNAGQAAGEAPTDSPPADHHKRYRSSAVAAAAAAGDADFAAASAADPGHLSAALCHLWSSNAAPAQHDTASHAATPGMNPQARVLSVLRLSLHQRLAAGEAHSTLAATSADPGVMSRLGTAVAACASEHWTGCAVGLSTSAPLTFATPPEELGGSDDGVPRPSGPVEAALAATVAPVALCVSRTLLLTDSDSGGAASDRAASGPPSTAADLAWAVAMARLAAAEAPWLWQAHAALGAALAAGVAPGAPRAALVPATLARMRAIRLAPEGEPSLEPYHNDFTRRCFVPMPPGLCVHLAEASDSMLGGILFEDPLLLPPALRARVAGRTSTRMQNLPRREARAVGDVMELPAEDEGSVEVGTDGAPDSGLAAVTAERHRRGADDAGQPPMFVETLSVEPPVFIARDFLTPAECDAIIAAGKPRLQRGSGHRNAMTATLGGQEALAEAALARLVQRAAVFVGIDYDYVSSHVELQLVHYKTGGYIALHQDSSSYFGKMLSLFVYLNDLPPDAGGETMFPWKRGQHMGNLAYDADATTGGDAETSRRRAAAVATRGNAAQVPSAEAAVSGAQPHLAGDVTVSRHKRTRVYRKYKAGEYRNRWQRRADEARRAEEEARAQAARGLADEDDPTSVDGMALRCDAGLRVRPERGAAVLWYNHHRNGTLDTLAAHAGCIVKGPEVEKWGANVWVRA